MAEHRNARIEALEKRVKQLEADNTRQNEQIKALGKYLLIVQEFMNLFIPKPEGGKDE